MGAFFGKSSHLLHTIALAKKSSLGNWSLSSRFVANFRHRFPRTVLIMNHKKHMIIFLVIAVVGFVVLLFAPNYGAALLLPALGALLGARKAESAGPSQPSFLLWGVFFVFVAIAVFIRYLVPEENFGGFDQWPESAGLFLLYSGVLAVAYLLFGYLAYLQRIGRTNSSD